MVHHPYFAKAYRFGQGMIEQVVGDVRRQQNQRARGRTLIVGAGTGLDVPHLPATATPILLEPDGTMRQYLHQHFPNIPVLSDSAEVIGAGDAAFDTVITSLVLCSVQDLDAVLAEMYRVLKPGGTYLFMEHVRHTHAVSQRVQDAINPIWKRVGGGCNLNRDVLSALERSAFQIHEYNIVKPNAFLPVVAGSARRPPSNLEE